MVCNFIEQGRRGMTVSVVILGFALLTVMLAYLVFGDTNDAEGLRTLRMIGIVFRHGDRTPTALYPNDPHFTHPWPGGLGSLSEKGSGQMYNLGKNLRTRYYRLQPPSGIYSKDDMYVLSSAAERCLMSAQSFLAGFLPPLENRNPLPIHWQPVAVNSYPRDRDFLMAQKKACPKYDATLKKLYDLPPKELKELNEKNAALYKSLSKNTGLNITNVQDVELLYNILEIERINGLTLPDWTEDVFPDKMLPLAERNLALITETPFMKKIKGGAIVTEIVDNMVKKRSHNLKPERSIFIYSGHDVTLVNLMRALSVLNQTSAKPDYGAAFVFELHHSVIFEDDFEIKIVYYYDSDDKFPKELSIPNCDAPCSLTAFTKAVDHLMVRNYDEICELV